VKWGEANLDQVSTQLMQRGLIVENVLLRDIQLPATLRPPLKAKQAGRAGVGWP